MGSTVEQADAQSPGKGHSVTITVNNKAVEVIGPRVTGFQIKEAAIAQGVQIEVDFQLSQELPSGETRIIGDADVVAVNKNSVFTAVAGDDNS
ncbi:multiubiquitin domain-containing protein [Streptomyces massasporeus]|uniref:multiubiquitin domain-containing protein n=1 Tax=Streptomyces massasporeus TaxID=67324 RepID=UPI000F4B5325